MYNVEQKQHAGKTGEAFYTTLEVCALWPEGEREAEGVLWHTYDMWGFSGDLLYLKSYNTSFRAVALRNTFVFWLMGKQQTRGRERGLWIPTNICFNPLVWNEAKRGKDEMRIMSISSHMMQNENRVNIGKGKTWTKILKPGGTKMSRKAWVF